MIKITESAANRFKIMIKDLNLLPRVEITSGGCNGFEKKFSLDTKQEDDVELILQNGITLLIDSYSFEMLNNSTVDYKSTLTGSFFSIEIPEAQSNCGCGSSFSL